jgi:hypothetical protein
MRSALIQRLSSESSDAIIRPMSSGTPARPSAVPAATLLFTAGLSRTIPPLKSVSVAPGATTLTAILHVPSSFAIYFVSTSTAPFIEPYAAPPGEMRRVRAVDTLTIRPPSLMSGSGTANFQEAGCGLFSHRGLGLDTRSFA